MGIKDIAFDMRRQQRIETVSLIEHKRIVSKAVAVVVHVIPIKEESGIPGF